MLVGSEVKGTDSHFVFCLSSVSLVQCLKNQVTLYPFKSPLLCLKDRRVQMRHICRSFQYFLLLHHSSSVMPGFCQCCIVPFHLWHKGWEQNEECARGTSSLHWLVLLPQLRMLQLWVNKRAAYNTYPISSLHLQLLYVHTGSCYARSKALIFIYTYVCIPGHSPHHYGRLHFGAGLRCHTQSASANKGFQS